MSTPTTLVRVEDLQPGDYFFHYGSWYLVRTRARVVHEGEAGAAFRDLRYRIPAFATSGALTDALIYADEVPRADERPGAFKPSYLRRKARNHRDAAQERMNQAQAIEDLAAIVEYEGAGKR